MKHIWLELAKEHESPTYIRNLVRAIQESNYDYSNIDVNDGSSFIQCVSELNDIFKKMSRKSIRGYKQANINLSRLNEKNAVSQCIRDAMSAVLKVNLNKVVNSSVLPDMFRSLVDNRVRKCIGLELDRDLNDWLDLLK